jgi:large subunit ribosomal protein L34
MVHFGPASITGLISIQQANCPVSGELPVKRTYQPSKLVRRARGRKRLSA